MSNVWLVLPDALQRARLSALVTQEELAKKSGVSVRSIRNYEAGEQPVRLETLQCVAKALSVEVRAIARLKAQAKERAKGDASSAPVDKPSVLPPRTSLEALVDIEAALALDPQPVSTPLGEFPVLTAKRLQDVFTAFALHDKKRFALTGRVDTQRGIDDAEARLLAGKSGVLARFHLVSEVAPGHPFGVTVHTAKDAHTAELQELHRKRARLVVRVHVAPEADARPEIGFTSFITKVTARRPWTFVVESVEPVVTGTPTRPARSRSTSR